MLLFFGNDDADVDGSDDAAYANDEGVGEGFVENEDADCDGRNGFRRSQDGGEDGADVGNSVDEGEV